MTVSPSDLLCFALHSTAHAVHAAYAPLLQPLGLTYPQYLALTVLGAREGMTVGQLGAELRLDSNTLTPLLKRMEAAGWLTRSRDTRDERQVRLSLTDAGRDLAQKLPAVAQAFAEKTGFQSSEIADLRDIVLALRDTLKADKS